MKHHFADFLDRTGNYWTVIPNRERFAFIADFEIDNKDDVKVLTISKTQENQHWKQIFDCPNLEELTLNDPSHEQVQEITKLTKLKRLRVTFYRAKDIEFIGKLKDLEELVLEYVSGFSDLSPLRNLPKLKSFHCENLRRVSNFNGLSGIKSLKYLSIRGTLDWKQPIEDFTFFSGLSNLEIFSVWQVIAKKEYPAFLPLCLLKKIKKISIHYSYFSTEEYVLIQTAFPDIEGTDWKPINIYKPRFVALPSDDYRNKLSDEELKEKHPEVIIRYDGKREISDVNEEWFEFLGKKAGRIKCTSKNAQAKCTEFLKKYNKMKENAQKLIDNIN